MGGKADERTGKTKGKREGRGGGEGRGETPTALTVWSNARRDRSCVFMIFSQKGCQPRDCMYTYTPTVNTFRDIYLELFC